MGLDSVELVMDLEDAFKMTLPDNEICKTTTPGMVADLVYSLLQTIDKKRCQSQVAFYKIRSHICNSMNIPRANIKPDTLLKEIFPAHSRKRPWYDLVESISYSKHSQVNLEFPRWIHFCGLFILSIGLCFLFLMMIQAFIGSLCLLFLFYYCVLPWRVCFPEKFIYVKDLIDLCGPISNLNMTRDQILDIVINVTANKLCIDKNIIKEDSHFIKDLGMD